MRRLRAQLPAIATAIGATAYLFLYRGAPTAFDEWLALPIGLESARPGTYPANDLLVQESLNGPFHLYKASAWLWKLGLDVDLAWAALLAVALVAFFLALWRLAGSLGLTDRERVVLVLATAVTNVYRGTLHWSAQPMLSFITASVAVPIGILAVTAAIEGRLPRALVLSALAFDVHPALGLCAGFATLCMAPAPFAPRSLVRAWLPAALVGAPNVIYLATHLPAPSAGNGDRLWDVHRIFGWHTFVRDHADGYPWFMLALAVAIVGGPDDERARRAKRGAMALTLLAAFWIADMNLAPIPSLLPFYLVRASWLVKPIMMSLMVLAVVRRRVTGRYAALVPVAAVLAVAHFDRIPAEAALAIVFGFVLLGLEDQRQAWLGRVVMSCGIAIYLSLLARDAPALDPLTELTQPLRWTAAAVALLALLMPRRPLEAVAPWRTPSPWLTLAIPLVAVVLSRPWGRSILPDAPQKIVEHVRLSRPLPREAGVMNWAREQTPRASMFAVPPAANEWVRFRLAAERGVYASIHDINQLMYLRDRVGVEVDRLQSLGLVVRGPHRLDPRPFLWPTCARLKRLAADGVDYYILTKDSRAPMGSVVAYQDSLYGVLDLKRTAPACGTLAR